LAVGAVAGAVALGLGVTLGFAVGLPVGAGVVAAARARGKPDLGADVVLLVALPVVFVLLVGLVVGLPVAVPVGAGGMAALLGPTVEEAQAICDEAAQGEVVSVANINSPGQVVIAGTAAGIDRAIAVAKTQGKKAIKLEVSAPFHCALMKPAEERLKPLLDEAPFKDLWVSLVSNVDASPIGTPTAVRNALIRQVVSPVRWVESVQKMIAMGVRRFVEVGPKNVLTGMIKRIDKTVELINVSDVASIEAYAEKLK